MWCRGSIHQKQNKVKEWRKKNWSHKAFFYRILKDLMNTLHTQVQRLNKHS